MFEKQQRQKDEREKNPNPQITTNHLCGSALERFLPVSFEPLPISTDLLVMYLPATVHFVRVVELVGNELCKRRTRRDQQHLGV